MYFSPTPAFRDLAVGQRGTGFFGSGEGATPELFHVHDHVVGPPTDVGRLSRNINVYELFAVLVALRRWGPALSNTLVQVVTDNNQVLYMINTGRSANKTCMSRLREIYWLCFIFNLDLYATYIKSKDNIFADALSRVSCGAMNRGNLRISEV